MDEHSKLKASAYAITPLLVLLVDLLSKWIAEAKLQGGRSLEIIGDFLRFTLVHNYGTTFGLFSASAPWLAISLVKLMFIFALFVCLVNMRRIIVSA